MWLYVFVFISVLFVAYLYLRFARLEDNKMDTSTTLELQNSSKGTAPTLSEYHYVLVGAKSEVKYYFYPVYIFHSKESLELYKKIIVEHVMIEEPFHTAFVNILVFLDKNDDCIKSNRTQEFKLKIQNSGEKGSAYLVYSIKELIFETLLGVFEKVKYSHGRYSVQALLLATAFVHMQKMKQWTFLRNEAEDEIEQCISIAKSFMKSESRQRMLVFEMIINIKEHHNELSFVSSYFEHAKRYAKEYPYIEHQHDEPKLLPSFSASIYTKKSLYTIGDFGI